MRKLFHRLALILFSAYFLSSCAAFHNGYMANSTTLGCKNFKYIEHDASGSAKSTYFLGIGGFGHNALVAEAKEDLVYTYIVEDNQSLANITVSWETKVWIVFITTHTCTITADIVEFDE